jgi:hypothetical protein
VGGVVTSTATAWWFRPVGTGRIATLRVIAYAFVPIDVLLTTTWVAHHGDVPGLLYRPVQLARLLHLPTPTPLLVDVLRSVLLAAAVAGLLAVITGATRLVRVSGVVVAGAYLWWMLVAMSYGKVDHDRVAYLVLLAVLPTVGAARLGDQTPSPAAGWAVRMVQVAAVATYFLAAWAKIRFGGWGWVNGATLSRAVIRRGTLFSDWMLQAPWLLRLAQWGMVIGELLSPVLLFVRERWRVRLVLGLVVFHVVTFATLRIIFLPHIVALAVFVPWERLGARRSWLAVSERSAQPAA